MNCNYILVNHTNNDVTCFVGSTKDKQRLVECANDRGMELYIHMSSNGRNCTNLNYLFLGMWMTCIDTFEFMQVIESYKLLKKLT